MMKLFEMRTFPKKAALATLKFGRQGSPPYRRKATIFLPDDPEAEFFPLQKGRQFLLRETLGETHIWFGGTDERPFLVQMDPRVFDIFMKKGEKRFYAALKPNTIYRLEETLKVSSRRQGDIFALKIPYSWDDLNQMSLFFRNIELKPETVESRSIFGTRHRITGQYTKLHGFYTTRDGATEFGEGVIEAPDHSPLNLEGVHLLEQASYLYEPRKAD